MSTHTFGWVPDVPDHRDFVYAAPKAVRKALPASVDLRAKCPVVYDQGNLGSCTANAIGAAIQFDAMAQKLVGSDVMPSRMFIYYNERVMEGTVSEDAGAQIRDGIKSVATLGACSSKYWAYVIKKFAVKPPKTAYSQALLHKVSSYHRVPTTLDQLKGCLAEGFPFVFGFSVYESFESDAVAQTGIVPMPSKKEQLLGGHAVMAVGYSDKRQSFIVRNSWGSGWGDNGYFYMPYPYLTNSNLSDDFWTVRLTA